MVRVARVRKAKCLTASVRVFNPFAGVHFAGRDQVSEVLWASRLSRIGLVKARPRRELTLSVLEEREAPDDCRLCRKTMYVTRERTYGNGTQMFIIRCLNGCRTIQRWVGVDQA